MKILNVMPFPPAPPDCGGALREFYLLKSLASQHEVTVLTYGSHKQLMAFIKEFGNIVEEIYMLREPWQRRRRRFAKLQAMRSSSNSDFYNCHYTLQMQDKITELLSEKKFDAVHCEFSAMGNFDFGEGVIKVLNTHNVEYENYLRMGKKTRSLFRKWYYYNEYKKVYQEEISALKKQDAIFSASCENHKIIRKNVPDVPNYIISNGVDTSFFRPSVLTRPEPYSLVFTGMMGYFPNSDGIHYFLNKIFPLIQMKIPKAKIYVVGKNPPRSLKRRASKTVIVTDVVEDVRPYIWRSSVFVVPIRMGSGTRFKVLEALAMKKPVVTTSIGCEGIDVEDGISALIKDDPKAFAESVVRVLRRRELGKRLAETGYKFVKDRHDWSIIGDRMLAVYDSLIPQKQTSLNWFIPGNKSKHWLATK